MSSSSECITWFAVFLTASVAIVMVNFLSIVLFMKNSKLRTRAMYLVINLTVADMFVGLISFFFVLIELHERLKCDIVSISLTLKKRLIITSLFDWFPLTSNKHCSNFFRSVACDFPSIQASFHNRKCLLGNNFRNLGFTCHGISYTFVIFSILE